MQSLGIMINSLITEAVLGRDGGVKMREGGGETVRKTGRRRGCEVGERVARNKYKK